jgi:hypothetical protein
VQISPHTDRLMAEIRGNIASIAYESANAGEVCKPFSKNDTAYEEWITQHAAGGYVLHRDTASAKIAYLHLASCSVVGKSEGVSATKSPKVGCPTRAAALTFAEKKKWEVRTSCDECATGK